VSVDPAFACDRDSLRAGVGTPTFLRGVACADGGAVRQVAWREEARALVGAVDGSRGERYITTARFDDAEPARFRRGECSCPVRHDCKHAVALALVASRQAVLTPPAPAGPQTWETPWESLLSAPQDDADLASAGRHTVAIELSLARRPTNRWDDQRLTGSLELSARLVRSGRKGWVAGGLAWGRLAGAGCQSDYDGAQIRVLQDLHALYRARTGGGWTGYAAYGEDRVIQLSAITSGALFPLLDAALAAGVRLIHADSTLGDLPPIVAAELCLDITGADGAGEGLRAAPVLRIDGSSAAVVPVAFLGNGIGAVVVPAEQSNFTGNPARWPLRLVSLAQHTPTSILRLALDQQSLPVPAQHHDRFRDEYYPRLRLLAPVISSDGSFIPPQISAPVLVLHAEYGADHALTLRWGWDYDVSGTQRRLPLHGEDGAGYRDRAAEAALRAGLGAAFVEFGLGGDGAGTASCTDLDTMRFTTELLPLLRDRDDVRLEILGTPAAYREADDAVRIGISTKAVANDGDWFDLGISITVDGETVPFLDLFVALARGRSHLLLPGGAYFSLDKPQLRALRRLIEEARALSDSPDGPLRISRYQTSVWEELVGLGVVERQAAAWKAHVAALRKLERVGGAALPAGVHAELRPYQREGFEWLAFLWEHRLGGILADDMGLGKTLQSLALIAHARAAEPDAPPFLIVAPTSVVSNWATESARFTPGLRVRTVSGTAQRTARMGGADLAELAAGADVVVTSYALLRIDAESYQAHDWAGLLLDEAQFVKNRNAKVHRAARQLHAPFKLAITGTPLENSVLELWSLLSITAPGLFPDPGAFKEFYATPIERNGNAELLAQLRRRIRPLLKRRTKEQVAPELPAKQEQRLELELDPRHRKIYDVALARERQKVLKLLDDLDGNRFMILRSITLLRRLSLHPGLVEEEHLGVPNAKIDELLAHLDAVAGTGHRTLVFSQFTGLLDLIETRLRAAGIEFCRLDGSTPRRAEVIARFKAGDVPVFLISLKAGGFGLNLTEADYCFLMDPWWNPAAEAQAVDRTHRIGQTRTVHVYRLIAHDTIEARVMALQGRKSELFASVLDTGDGFGGRFDVEDIRDLFA
jgi:superfamily II DNA or RNA helicase